MALRDVFKITRKTFFNPSSWFDINFFLLQNNTIKEVVRNMMTTPTPELEETFDAAMKRQGIQDKDIKPMANRYRQYALIFFVLGGILFLYAFYLLFRYVTITGWMLGIAISAFMWAQAFKYDFYALQLRKRKLGLTFDEWLHHTLGTKGKSK